MAEKFSTASLLLTFLHHFHCTMGNLEEGYVEIRIPQSYHTPVESKFGRTKMECAFECAHRDAECMAFTFEDGKCQLATIKSDRVNNFIPEHYVPDANTMTVLIKKDHVTLNAKVDVMHVGYLGPENSNHVYDLVLDEDEHIQTKILQPVEGPFFAVLGYKSGILACGGLDDMQCRFDQHLPLLKGIFCFILCVFPL